MGSDEVHARCAAQVSVLSSSLLYHGLCVPSSWGQPFWPHDEDTGLQLHKTCYVTDS